MKLFARSLVALSAATILAGAANAATSVSTYAFGYNTANDPTSGFNPTSTDVNNDFTLAAFDQSLGTLTGVTLTYGYTVFSGGYFTLTSSGTSSSTATVDVGNNSKATLTFANSAFNPASKLTAITDFSVDSASVGTPYTINAQSDTMTGSKNIFANDLAGSAISGNFSSLTGSYSGTTPQGGNFDLHATSTAAGYVTVTYTYTAAAVPEPASWAMMVGGFGIVGGALRRKRPATLVKFG